MREIWPQLAALATAAALLSSCSSAPVGGSAASSAPATSPSGAAGATPSPSPDTETSVPAPAPEISAPPAGPGQGNAELAVTVIPAEGEPEVSYTLVCEAGVPAAESSHPAPGAACAAIQEKPSLLSPNTQSTAQACTQQYGGPQTATVSGVVDGMAVDAEFARTNGCEISAWDAARDILGHAGGAA
ncbi:SSI family serine proteinase inhibitor [Arthrobacter sp. MPF02]|uniref:SSI family serine proteinase inhibitor n=1 Tax=Arthrobacter sp. MPF02 TaxID=3388492 RepID=UPI0039852F28